MLLAMFLAAELNPFYLKVCCFGHQYHLASHLFGQSLLWMEPDHPIVIMRLAGVFLCALPAVRELFQYINDPR
jgi:phosphatidylserine synthase 2